VLTQIVDALRATMTREIIGAANDHEREGRRQPHGNHVGGNELTQSDAGVKALGREVDQLPACGDLHFDVGIGLAEGCDQRLDQDRHD
jgi:hypothetical protein